MIRGKTIKLLKPLITVSTITIFSRIFGFIRDTIIARVFGVDAETDAFFTAFKLPNLLRRIFAEGVFSQVIIPILIKYRNQKDQKAIRKFISCISGILISILLIIIIICISIAPWIIMIIAPGFSENSGKINLAIKILRITFPYILFISLASLVGAILNTWNNFFVPAFAPILLNLSMICFMLFAVPLFNPPILTLAWAVLVGGILQLSYQFLYLKKINMSVVPSLKFNDTETWYVLKSMGPAILAVSINQISFIMNTIFLSFLDSGSVSWIYYADRLAEFPSGVLGAALGTILLPSMSHSILKRNKIEYSRIIDFGLRLCFLLALPSSVALGILAKPIIITLFQYGNFSDFDTLMIQEVLTIYSIGLTGFILVKVLTPGFYSCQNVKTLTYISIITITITQLMNLVFIIPLKHAGISLSMGLGAYLNAGLLYWQLRCKKIFQLQSKGWLTFFFQLIIGVVVMSVVLIIVLFIMPGWTNYNMFWRFLQLIGVILVGVISYIGTLYLVGFQFKKLSDLHQPF